MVAVVRVGGDYVRQEARRGGGEDRTGSELVVVEVVGRRGDDGHDRALEGLVDDDDALSFICNVASTVLRQ